MPLPNLTKYFVTYMKTNAGRDQANEVHEEKFKPLKKQDLTRRISQEYFGQFG